MADIILGLGFGDEGKGLVVDYLTRQRNQYFSPPLIVRFNGGAQAGHTVVTPEGKRHVFSHFGSGTLAGGKTFWSKYCPMSPMALFNEAKILSKLIDEDPLDTITFDPLCPVTTHYDIWLNQTLENSRRGESGGAGEIHGSVGVGFGTSVLRHRNTPHRLFASDLYSEEATRQKLSSIRTYFYQKIIGIEKYAPIFLDHNTQTFMNETDTIFIETIAKNLPKLRLLPFEQASQGRYMIFEGAQGILLDEDHGLAFPHLTPSFCTRRNAMELLNSYNKHACFAQIHYVTRTYLTRHGAGPLPGEGFGTEEIGPYEDNTNHSNRYQGRLRFAPFNEELIEYAIRTDCLYGGGGMEKYYLTHADQVEMPKCLPQKFKHDITFVSYGPTHKDIKEI